jgi:transcriptional regulator NrdR family protein
MQCPKCGANDVIEIRQNLPDGTELHFCSCHKCAERWWDRDGEQLELADVLKLTRDANS